MSIISKNKNNIVFYLSSIKRSQIIVLLIFTIFMNIFLNSIGYLSHHHQPVNLVYDKNERVLTNKKGDILKYPDLLKCSHQFNSSMLNESIRDNYHLTSNEALHNLRIIRGIIIYYPASQYEWFEDEFRWFYRSWIEMQKYEPSLWRTDIVIFMDHKLYLSTQRTMFQELNCSLTNIRKTRKNEPMCTILDYVSIKERTIPILNETFLKSELNEDAYRELFRKINIFDDTPQNLWKFYIKLKELNHYNYVDSILIAFDGYKYFQKNFDFLMRSDMDVFLTPFFAKWLPLNCFDFITGMGGYSHDFNMKRLRKAGKLMGLKFKEVRNLGSTWISTPKQFRLVSYLTLVSMCYINSEEFSQPERDQKVGTILWPEWHYGVLLLYGQCMAMNHLIATKQLHVKELGTIIDYSSQNNGSIFSVVHIHAFHVEQIFSKFMYRDGKYANLPFPYGNLNLSNYYALYIAVDSKQKSLKELYSLFKNVITVKKEKPTFLERISDYYNRFANFFFFWRCNCPCNLENDKL